MDFNLITDEPLDYCVYAHINKQNGKMYIGITRNVKKRFGSCGRQYRGSTHFYNAIQKYGWDSFKHVVLVDNIPLSLANIMEKELIAKYDTIRHGYNINVGGQSGYTHFNPSSKIVRPIFQYDLCGNFIQRWERPVDAQRYYGVKDVTQAALYGGTRAGYQWSYEYVEKMQPFSSPSNLTHLPIYQYDKEGNFIKKWEESGDAIKEYGVNVRVCAKGGCRTAYKYRWSFDYAEKLEPLPRIIQPPRKPKPKNPYRKYENSPKVFRFGMDGQLIRIYDNCASIDDVDVNMESVYELCRKREKYVYHESIWVYKEDAYNGYVQEIIDKHKQLHPRIVQYGLDGKYINTYKTLAEITRLYGFEESGIGVAMRGKMQTAYGYQWRYEHDDPPKPVKDLKNGSPKPVVQRTLDGNFVAKYRSAMEATKVVTDYQKVNSSAILDVCYGRRKNAYGFLWEFYDKEKDLNLRREESDVKD